MEIRLNKLISEAGVCSRREADNFIEMERVTVNGKQPHVGQKVTAEDVVLVDGERLNVEKYIRLQEEEKKEVQQEKELLGTLRKAKPENKGGREGAKMEKFGKFNKYAAARKAQKVGGWKSKTAKLTDEEKLLRDALRPKFGKALSKDCSYVDTNHHGRKILSWIIENGLGELTGQRNRSGYCTYEKIRFYPEKLKDCDPEGYQRYKIKFEET